MKFLSTQLCNFFTLTTSRVLRPSARQRRQDFDNSRIPGQSFDDGHAFLKNISSSLDVKRSMNDSKCDLNSIHELSKRLQIQESQLTAITQELEEAVILRSKLEGENEEYEAIHSTMTTDTLIALKQYRDLRKSVLDSQLSAKVLQRKMHDLIVSEISDIMDRTRECHYILSRRKTDCLMRYRHSAGDLFTTCRQTTSVMPPLIAVPEPIRTKRRNRKIRKEPIQATNTRSFFQGHK